MATTKKTTEEAKVKQETPKIVYGVVTAVRLNVRYEPSLDAGIATVVEMNDELMIDRDKSNSQWYAVTTESRKHGYVMRKFVKIKR